METITQFFHNVQHSSSDPVSIVLLWRQGHSPDLKDDPYFVRFKSWKIRGLVHDHFSVLHLQEATCLFNANKGSADSSTLAFEWLANVYISGKDQQGLKEQRKVFWQFAPMADIMIKAKAAKARKDSASAEPKYKFRFQHSLSGNPYVLLILMPCVSNY